MLPLKPKAVTRTARNRELKDDLSILMGVRGRQIASTTQNSSKRRNRFGLTNNKENKFQIIGNNDLNVATGLKTKGSTKHTTIHDLPHLVTATQTRSVVSELSQMDRKAISSSGHGENSGWKILKSRPAFRNNVMQMDTLSTLGKTQQSSNPNFMSSLFRTVQLPSNQNSCESVTSGSGIQELDKNNPMIQSLWISKKSMFGDPSITRKYSIQDILDIMCGKLSPPQEFREVGQFHSAPNEGSSSMLSKTKPVKRKLFALSPNTDSSASTCTSIPKSCFPAQSLSIVEDPFKIPIGPPLKKKPTSVQTPSWSFSAAPSVNSFNDTTTSQYSLEESPFLSVNPTHSLSMNVGNTFEGSTPVSDITNFDPLSVHQSNELVYSQNHQNLQFSPIQASGPVQDHFIPPSPDIFTGLESHHNATNNKPLSFFDETSSEVSHYHFGNGASTYSFTNENISGQNNKGYLGFPNETEGWTYETENGLPVKGRSFSSQDIVTSSQMSNYNDNTSKWNKYSVEYNF